VDDEILLLNKLMQSFMTSNIEMEQCHGASVGCSHWYEALATSFFSALAYESGWPSLAILPTVGVPNSSY